jgi:hypothetical protein
LDRCPFCGSFDVSVCYWWPGPPHHPAFIACGGCRAEFYSLNRALGKGLDLEDLWNLRAAPSNRDAVLRLLTRAILLQRENDRLRRDNQMLLAEREGTRSARALGMTDEVIEEAPDA